MINLDDLTLGQIKGIQKLLGAKETNKESKEDFGKQIVILQRGWVAIGDLTKIGDYYELENAYIIRRWGTTNGLGQLASQGKQSKTELEPTPLMRFHELTVISFIKCDKNKWK
jgi:hypothetical protein